MKIGKEIAAGIKSAIAALESLSMLFTVSKVRQTLPNGKPGGYATVNDDSGLFLANVGNTYVPIQLIDIGAAVDKVCESNVTWKRGGTFKGERRIWLMGEIDGHGLVNGKSALRRSVFVHTTHDGSGLLVIRGMSINEYCLNQLAAAVRWPGQKGENIVSGKHSGNVAGKLLSMSGDFSNILQDFAGYQLAFQSLAEVKVTDEQAKGFFLSVFPDKGEKRVTRMAGQRDRMLELFAGGRGVRELGLTGTAAALIMAQTEYDTHERSTRVAGVEDEAQKVIIGEENRVENMLLGSGLVRSTRTMELALAQFAPAMLVN